MGSPALFGGNNTSTLLQNALRLNDGTLINANGPKNYIANGTAFLDTIGWATYADSAANIPADGTGGTATNLTFSRSTSSPLSGVASFSMVQANSTSLQGKGVSYAFSVDSCDQASVLSIQFNYNASTTFVASNGTTAPLNDGTTTTNAGNSDIEVFIYDVTNAVLIPVSPEVITANGTNNFVFKGTFQTSPNSTSYRLILHVATTSANATGWTFKFDNMFVGPQFVGQGPVITDPVAYTPTFTGWGTAAAVNVVSWRQGAYLCVEGKVTAGTPTATEARMSLGFNGRDGGITSASTLGSPQLVGKSNVNAASATDFSGETVLCEPSVTYVTFGQESSTTSGLTKRNGNGLWGAGAIVSFFFRVPVAGWSSNTTMSNDADTRVVAAKYSLSGNLAVTSGTAINFDTLVFDTHSAVTTGAGTWKFTAPVSGIYVIEYTGSLTTSGCSIYAAKNGTGNTYIGSAGVSEDSGGSAVNLIAGDTLALFPDATRTFAGGTSSSAALTSVSIYRLSGPATIAASESVNARYYASATSISGSLATIVWTTKDFDSHNAMSSGLYTIPIAGKYQVNCNIAVAGTIALNTTTTVQIQKNSVAVSDLTTYAGGAMTNQNGQVSDTISCLAGDIIRIQLSSSATLPTIVSSNTRNFFSIERVGN